MWQAIPRSRRRMLSLRSAPCSGPSPTPFGTRQHLVDGARGAALKLLHHIRGVSLHPEPPDTVQDDLAAYFARSARFDSFRRILGRIHARGERALIFTEHRRMQAFVAQWIRSEFGLDEVRIINGATTIARRKAYVSAFQRHLENDGGFDVLILSPRAAGVGLTLTAATHVIHLSRWWNPAVEEQCNDRIYRIGAGWPLPRPAMHGPEPCR